MIHLLPKPLPEPQANEIRAWLSHPASKIFRDVVAQMAMACTARGANKAVEVADTREEAVANAEDDFLKAQTANNILTLMAEMMTPDFKFEHFEIGPRPFTNPQPTEPE